jgi:hypothetical protein
MTTTTTPALCHRVDCGTPVTGIPVTDPEDRAGRKFCSPDCLEAAAAASFEQRYQPGVAT